VAYAAPTLHETDVTCEIVGPKSLAVKVDPLLFGQAVLNLVLNAAQAIGRTGKIRLVFGPPPTESDARQFHLVVSDSGPGIPAGTVDRIFNPFFTTKETGTGLGLSIVHRVIEAHDGSIVAGNDPAGGARFEVRI
jgi:two-component system, NtrC family, sensor histidine kinase HydH